MLAKIIYSYAQHVAASIADCKWHIGFLTDLNDFPAISVLRPSSADAQQTIRYIGDARISTIRLMVRGYTYSSADDGDSVDATEQLCADIEAATASYPHSEHSAIRNILIQDARVLSIETDAGLMSPYGICDVEVELFYVEEN